MHPLKGKGRSQLSNRFYDMPRARRNPSSFQLTSKTLLALLALIAMAGSGAYWWGVQSQLTSNAIVAAAYTAILVLAPPSLVSFLIPWSPAGMLLQKVNMRTIGYAVVIGCAAYLLYYSWYIQTAWWAAQPVVADANLVSQQMLIGIIGFIIIPALLWTPVSSHELVEQVRQAHLVKRYELQTQADIAILRATLLRAQQLALKGFANLTLKERQELAGAMNGLMTSIDRTLHEVGDTVKVVSGVALPFDGMLDDNEDIRGVLDYISDSLVNTDLGIEVPAAYTQATQQTQSMDMALIDERSYGTSEGRETRRIERIDDELHSLENNPRGTSLRSRSRSRDR